MRRSLEGLITIDPHAAGMHLVGWLPRGVSEVAVEWVVVAGGVELYSLARFTAGPRPVDARGALLFAYAGYDDRQIRRAVDRMTRSLEPFGSS
ncbi:MAG: hypothetical protein ABIP93_20085 [Gemmatimonadaceae bacterium]